VDAVEDVLGPCGKGVSSSFLAAFVVVEVSEGSMEVGSYEEAVECRWW